MDGGNGCLYGIPCSARRVVEYTLEDKSVKEIGPDLGKYEWKYWNGIKADNGCIYCVPCEADFFLKIIPGEGKNTEVRILQEQEIPRHNKFHWSAGVLANDGCIYYLPHDDYGGRILMLNPSDGDSLSFIGRGIIDEYGFTPVVLGNDGYIYGIARNRIIKFSPMDHSVSYIGTNFEEHYHSTGVASAEDYFRTGAVLADDGYIYSANQYGQIIRIEPEQNDWKIIGNRICDGYSPGWGCPVLGADKCIYFPPAWHDRVLKFNPTTQSISLIDESYEEVIWKWQGAVLASDGFIYCVPYFADDILQIDSRHVNEQVIAMIETLNVLKT